MGWTFQSGTQLGKNVLNSRCSAQNVSKGIFAGGDTSLGKGSTSYWVPGRKGWCQQLCSSLAMLLF